ncbi:MAG: FAD-binding domain-containing protein [Puniceicoccaceae bacterium]
MQLFSTSRSAALSTLQDFVPEAVTYGQQRNFDNGPGAIRPTTSRLSPYLRLRIISEEEVLSAVLAKHSLHHVEKFVQEVLWRTYWKGWLEMRPSIWHQYCRRLIELESFANSRPVRSAVQGTTGIECFDSWVHELTQTGFLHNHTRMWFASIWIFTLKLPWELGAAFFIEHLYDGDPASNTLSWRWVAGLQTPGKHYLATAENIRRFTSGRFYPKGQLDEEAPPLESDHQIPSPKPVPALAGQPKLTPDNSKTAYLLHPEDLSPTLPTSPGSLLFYGSNDEVDNLEKIAPAVASFRSEALDSAALELVARHHLQAYKLQPEDWFKNLTEVLESEQVRTLVTPFAPLGPWRLLLDRLSSHCQSVGIKFQFQSRLLDQLLYPKATHGFFRFKKAIPETLRSLNFTTN